MRILQIAELLLIRLCSICTAATLFYKWTIYERATGGVSERKLCKFLENRSVP